MFNAISYTDVLLPLALILLLGKLFSIVCKRFGLPQVLGLLISGILIGLIKLIPNQSILTGGAIEGISFISKIGEIEFLIFIFHFNRSISINI